MAPYYLDSLRQSTLREPISDHKNDIDVTGVISPLEKTLHSEHGDTTPFGITTEQKGKPVLVQLTYPRDSGNSHLSPQLKDLDGETVRYIRRFTAEHDRASTRWQMQVLTGANQGTTYEWLRHYKVAPKPVEKKTRG